MRSGNILMLATAVAILAAAPSLALGQTSSEAGPQYPAPAYGWGGPGWGGYGACPMMPPGMMGYGYGPGMMGPGYGPGMGGGMMGPGMMGPGMMGPGYGPGMGMMGGGRMPQMFAMVDQNEDGVVSADEAAALHEAIFAILDADDDGVITQAEHEQAHAGMGYGPAQGGQAARWQQRQAERFQAMDENGDGQVTQAEFMAAGERRFSEADADGDGRVTVWEFRSRRR